MKTLNTYITEWKAKTSTMSSINTQCFIYKLKPYYHKIKIFNIRWAQFEEYKDKVYINGKHVKIDNNGLTLNDYEPGTYKVYIEDIDNVTNCHCMFYDCIHLISVPLFDTSKVENMSAMFCNCCELTNVPLFDTSNCEGMYQMFYRCKKLKNVPLFDTSKVVDAYQMFYDCDSLNEQTKQEWSSVYDFETNK